MQLIFKLRKLEDISLTFFNFNSLLSDLTEKTLMDEIDEAGTLVDIVVLVSYFTRGEIVEAELILKNLRVACYNSL